jgi:hypothetical protein
MDFIAAMMQKFPAASEQFCISPVAGTAGGSFPFPTSRKTYQPVSWLHF